MCPSQSCLFVGEWENARNETAFSLKLRLFRVEHNRKLRASRAAFPAKQNMLVK
jgi:hypothetical protein